ncbi:MAG: PEP-CTERM sorting domain-containing protein [Phycisphaerae bacterium]|nr:PEP-CTERM sorting domain-containing protein [Phycisphaerae bacterium]
MAPYQNHGVRGVWGAAVVFSVVVLFVSVAAYGGAIEVIAANVSPTPVYFGDPQFEWFVPGADLTNGTVTEGGTSRTWYVAFSGFSPPGEFWWSGSALDEDLSEGGQAHATFLEGGTLSIEGQLLNEFFMPIYEGVLLSGSVSSFEVIETHDNNFLDLEGEAIFTPEGGALYDGGLGMKLEGPYYLDFSAAEAGQDGGDLEDFQTTVVVVDSFLFTLVQVPEPATVVLLGGCVIGFAIRRGRRR